MYFFSIYFWALNIFILNRLLAISCNRSVSNENIIHILTKHYEPFMYQNSNGTFNDGIEFKLIQTIADKLDLKINYVTDIDGHKPNR